MFFMVDAMPSWVNAGSLQLAIRTNSYSGGRAVEDHVGALAVGDLLPSLAQPIRGGFHVVQELVRVLARWNFVLFRQSLLC